MIYKPDTVSPLYTRSLVPGIDYRVVASSEPEAILENHVDFCRLPLSAGLNVLGLVICQLLHLFQIGSPEYFLLPDAEDAENGLDGSCCSETVSNVSFVGPHLHSLLHQRVFFEQLVNGPQFCQVSLNSAGGVGIDVI